MLIPTLQIRAGDWRGKGQQKEGERERAGEREGEGTSDTDNKSRKKEPGLVVEYPLLNLPSFYSIAFPL